MRNIPESQVGRKQEENSSEQKGGQDYQNTTNWEPFILTCHFFSNKNSRLPLYWDGLCAIIERRRKKDEAEQDDPSAGSHEKSLTIINTLKTPRQMCSG